MRSTGSNPPITALVCTADRADQLVRATRSILANTHPRFEVIVVDQSRDERTADALAPLLADSRLRYLRSAVKGKGRALNQGLAEANSEIVACTDDDCVVPSDWLGGIAAAFDRSPRIAVVFGRVEAAPYDPLEGFVPDYLPKADRLVTSIFDRSGTRGLGACMGVRRSAVVELGGFDPAFGPGGTFPSCDDWDIAIRAVRGGFTVYQTTNVKVVHHGFRTFREGRDLVRRDWYAIGGLCAKPVRAGEWRMIIAALELFITKGMWPPISDVLHLRRPAGLVRIAAFVRGFRRGLGTPVRSESLVFDLPE